MAHKRAHWLHDPYHLGDPTRGQNQKGTTRGWIGYTTPAVWGFLHKRTKSGRYHM